MLLYPPFFPLFLFLSLFSLAFLLLFYPVLSSDLNGDHVLYDTVGICPSIRLSVCPSPSLFSSLQTHGAVQPAILGLWMGGWTDDQMSGQIER